MISHFQQIENETHQIDSVLEKHAAKLEPDTLKLLRQLTKNIRYSANELHDTIQNFADNIIGDE
jgi:hypothetical protein